MGPSRLYFMWLTAVVVHSDVVFESTTIAVSGMNQGPPSVKKARSVASLPDNQESVCSFPRPVASLFAF